MADQDLSIRVAELEHRVGEQDKVIADLSDMVSQQWTKIELLERRLGQLREEFEESNAARKDAPEPPPPHY